MEIQEGINPNCSEATIRINLKNKNQAKIDELIKKLELELNEEYPSNNEQGDWDDEVIKREFEWSEGWVNYETIFGIDCLKISGDAPYNYSDEVIDVIKRYLPNAELEWSE